LSNVDEILKPYQNFIEAILQLFDPFVEVAVHDLKSGTIAAIYNSFSRRKIGDKSPIKELNIDVKDFPDVFPAYNELNWDGKELKCTTITIRDKKEHPVALICFNFDTSLFVQAKNTINDFLKIKSNAVSPLEAFGEGCEEQIFALTEHFLKEQQLAKSSLDRAQKKTLIYYLHDKGAFFYKNSVPCVAKMLKLSRASIYHYIKQLKNKAT
jgi:predicted transcriptional regulator YheO